MTLLQDKAASHGNVADSSGVPGGVPAIVEEVSKFEPRQRRVLMLGFKKFTRILLKGFEEFFESLRKDSTSILNKLGIYVNGAQSLLFLHLGDE